MCTGYKHKEEKGSSKTDKSDSAVKEGKNSFPYQYEMWISPKVIFLFPKRIKKKYTSTTY